MSTETVKQAISYHEAMCSETHPATYDPNFMARWNVGLNEYGAIEAIRAYALEKHRVGTAHGYSTDITVATTSFNVYAIGYRAGWVAGMSSTATAA